MESVELWLICISAFTMVFALLSVLAIIMRIITAVFPQKALGIDATMVAIVTSAVSSAFPGTKVTEIEETK
ncbi:MAG: hypothetical protein KOO62_00970 [candidate division Zixibacteria bacterium]|nr:hypothetical protein [candidate division Zixibacteria bacterium]